MTAGFFSPMPPARTGVADYSRALFEELCKIGPVKLGDTGAAARLYHLGNNQLHREIYREALAHPGVIVLHDAVLNHFFLGGLSEPAYIEEFVYNYGRWNAGLAGRLWSNRARSASDPLYFKYPMLRRIVERSLAVIVHNPAAARVVRQHVPAARVFEIPHLFATPTEPAGYEIVRLRDRLGAAPSDCLFAIFGHLRESKRLLSVIDAFNRLRRTGIRPLLLVAGDFASSDLARAAAPLVSSAGIRRTGYLPEHAFWLHAHAVDACINLRYPTAAETSGIAIRLMGIGKPVVLTAGEEISGLPGAAVVRIDPGPAERDMLFEYMSWLARFPGDARAVGAAARAHIAEHHHPSRVAARYWRVLEDSVAR
jgi:glycosyltransferase involved in cell wall biosynthesis